MVRNLPARCIVLGRASSVFQAIPQAEFPSPFQRRTCCNLPDAIQSGGHGETGDKQDEGEGGAGWFAQAKGEAFPGGEADAGG